MENPGGKGGLLIDQLYISICVDVQALLDAYLNSIFLFSSSFLSFLFYKFNY